LGMAIEPGYLNRRAVNAMQATPFHRGAGCARPKTAVRLNPNPRRKF